MPTHGNVCDTPRHSGMASAMSAMVLAHQGGWDEMLLVLGPIAVIFALLGIARRRTRR
jgi:hypothetical protein